MNRLNFKHLYSYNFYDYMQIQDGKIYKLSLKFRHILWVLEGNFQNE